MSGFLNKKRILNTFLTLGLFFVLLIPQTTIFAEDNDSTPINPSTTMEQAQSYIDTYIERARPLLEKNDQLATEREGLIKTELVQSGMAVSQTNTTPEENKKKVADIDNQIANNNASIKNNRALADKYLAYMGTKIKTNADKNIVNNYKLKIAEGFRTAKDGEIGACWSLTDGFQWGVCGLQIFSWVSTFVIYIFGTILYVAGELFDASIKISIEWVSSFFGSTGVIGAWRVLRDFSNIFFVFILLYIAIGTIFEFSGIGNPRKLIVNVIIVALLVNFSGFFVRIVVDASNVIAYEFYSATKGNSDNLGSSLVKQISPQKFLVKKGDRPTDEVKVQGQGFFGILVEMVFAILIILAASFVLIVASILFFIRTIVLLFVYIASPFAFMSQIIPNAKFNFFDSWKDALIKQSFYAPGFLAPLYVVFLVLSGDLLGGKLNEMKGSLDILANGTGGAALMGVLVLGLLISCIFIAQKFGAIGLEVATGAGSKFTQVASRPLSRYGGRLAGAAGSRIAQSGIGQRVTSSWNEGRLSRVRQSWDTGVLRDLRQTEAAKKVGQAVSSPLFTAGQAIGRGAAAMGVKGVDITGDKTFSKVVEDRGNALLDDLKKFETPAEQSRFLEGLAGFTSREEFDYIYGKMSSEDKRKVELAARKVAADTNASQKARDNARKVSERMAGSRQGLSGKKAQDLAAEMVKESKGADKTVAINNLSPEDFNAVYKKLSATERVELRKAAATAGNRDLENRLDAAERNLEAKDKNEVQRERSKQERATRSEEAVARINNLYQEGRGASVQANDISTILPEHITAISPTHLASPGFARNLTPGQLKTIKDTLPDQDKQAIKNEITRQIASAQGQLSTELQRLNAYFSLTGGGADF